MCLDVRAGGIIALIVFVGTVHIATNMIMIDKVANP